MYRKILVPVDGSPQAGKALETAFGLAKLTSAELCLLHVVTPPLQYAPEGPVIITQEVLENWDKKGISLLQEQLKQHAGPEVETTLEVLIGNPAELICTKAKDEDFDLIVIGSRGLGAIKGYLLGSVSDKVSHHAHCQVLLVH